jgi:molecular chaperone Hsp33
MIDATAHSDFIQSFQVEGHGNGPALRGRMVRAGSALCQALGRHDYPPVVSRLLAETVVLSLILSSTLKYQGVFTLQTKSDGPIKTLMADVTRNGVFRCYASFDEGKLDAVLANDEAPSLMRLLGPGYLSFNVDQGPNMEPYQGLTELTGGTLVDCAHHYFQQSEQLRTAVVALAEDRGQLAGALLIQQLPLEDNRFGDDNDGDENWRRAVTLMSTVTARELLDDGFPAENLLFRLFHEDGVRLFDREPVSNQCRCSEAKIRQTLLSFAAKELEDLYEDDAIHVVCEFCKTQYNFSHEDMVI